MSAFRVLQLDHLELFVPDRQEAAGWYRRVLGLEVLQEYERWAADPHGPLMISSDRGSTKLALFEGAVDKGSSGFGLHLVAFRVAASGFVEFLKRLSELQLRDHYDSAVTLDSVVDHEEAYSLYFCDPYGHRLELTS
jgi:catechol 2,3-dioxygenase-like lactoylglutathione lyase family enzyme